MDFDIKKLMEQAKTLQAELEVSQKKLELITASGGAGADMIRVTVNGANKVLSIQITDELYNSQDKKMLEDLVVAAVNNAFQNVSEKCKQEMEKITSNFPGFHHLRKYFY